MKKYNIELFTYRIKVLVLTEKGKQLLDFAVSMNANNNKIYEVMSLKEKQNINLNFGTTLTIGEFIMPDIIEKYIKKFPMCNICMLVDNTKNLLRYLKSGKIDFAFIEGNFDKTEFDYYTFSSQEFICICSNKNQYAEKTLNFKELLSERIIVHEKGSGTREVLEVALHEKNLTLSDFPFKFEIGNFNVIKKLISSNSGITFVYYPVVKNELKKGTFKRIYIENFKIIKEYTFLVLKNSLFKDEYITFFNFCHNIYANGH